MKLWFVIYIAHQVIFSQPMPTNDMSKCEQHIAASTAALRGVLNNKVSVNIAPQYLKHETPEQTMFCMWAEKDPIKK